MAAERAAWGGGAARRTLGLERRPSVGGGGHRECVGGGGGSREAGAGGAG